ncbi:hypothetical protein AMECASPLE_030637, partial [Ameca splendens]
MDYTSDTHKGSIKTEDCGIVEVEQLIPGTEYTFSITRIGENGNQSTAVSLFACTDPAPPVKITVSKLSSESLSFHWDIPPGAVQTYIVRCCSEGETGKRLATHKNSVTFDSLRPGVCYSLHVSTQLQNGRISKPAISSVKTKTSLESLLDDLGLEKYIKKKLSLSKILQIEAKTITDHFVE